MAAPDHGPAVATKEDNDEASQLVDAFTAAMPPAMAKQRDYSTDELLKEMNKVPLFMTSIDENDEEQAAQLEAMRAIAYEGTRAEIATNFKAQGNECVQEKDWFNAREYYSKAITALRDPDLKKYESPDAKVIELDEEAEAAEQRLLEEVCLANRALCNLEMKNYGSCNRDCAGALRLNPKNVKAWYRAASACLALDKIEEALDACDSGLRFESTNASLKALRVKIDKRQAHLIELATKRQQREERARLEKANLAFALKSRGIVSLTTPNPPSMEDAAPQLADATDPKSTLSLPVLFLYPTAAQSDFIKSVSEDDTLAEHLSYVLPPPWDEALEHTSDTVDCYMETIAGGLIKAGKKLSLAKLLGSGKVAINDGIVKVNIVPRDQATQWIETFKLRQGKK
ncbi:hypothetical protein AMS68_005134 [Peltaster fructicola]|uniref:Cns1/TTC4 wheel domain-containing protein n=1 Tax=Peltaster fructicola TaxID=286661 RepID=A0A6H0XXW2_9PEZI|nr:hypothetical protein AMS68_005134 [Peltaster fructicola]